MNKIRYVVHIVNHILAYVQLGKTLPFDLVFKYANQLICIFIKTYFFLRKIRKQKWGNKAYLKPKPYRYCKLYSLINDHNVCIKLKFVKNLFT